MHVIRKTKKGTEGMNMQTLEMVQDFTAIE